MTTKVVGSGFVGEKLVGNLDFFTVAVLTDTGASGSMPFLNTGVVATRAELVEAGELSDPTLSGTNSVTVVNPLGAFDNKDAASTTYIANAAYDLAYAQQRNLDLLIETIATKAQPVLMSDTAVVADWGSDDFTGGSEGDGHEATTFKFAVEHTAVFANTPSGSGNPLAADSKAVGLTSLLDDLGDALRANSATPSGENTWDATSPTNNFVITFAGTL